MCIRDSYNEDDRWCGMIRLLKTYKDYWNDGMETVGRMEEAKKMDSEEKREGVVKWSFTITCDVDSEDFKRVSKIMTVMYNPIIIVNNFSVQKTHVCLCSQNRTELIKCDFYITVLLFRVKKEKLLIKFWNNLTFSILAEI